MRLLVIALLFVACSRPTLASTEDEPIDRDTPEMMREREDALAHLAILEDPKGHLVIGSRCSYSGVQPTGRYALDELVRLRRVDLLRKLLRVRSAEGRTYAAIGLRRLGSMSSEALRSFLSSITGNIQVCSGCMSEEVPARQAISYYSDCDNFDL
jgi:hypothetical protein